MCDAIYDFASQLMLGTIFLNFPQAKFEKYVAYVCIGYFYVNYRISIRCMVISTVRLRMIFVI